MVSMTGFFIRGWALLLGAGWPKAPRIRRLVDVNDSLLIGAAIMLAALSKQYPFATSWVTAKVFGLIVYVALGVIAFRFAKTRLIRAIAWFAALLCAAYIVSVAVAKSPYGFLMGVFS